MQIKICGITNLEDGIAAAEAGADLLGFVFYPPSPRYVKPQCVSEIVIAVRQSSPGVQFAGVFVNEPHDHIAAIVRQCSMDIVQFSGSEPPEQVNVYAGRAYKSLRPRDADHCRALLGSYRATLNGNVPAYLVDAFNPHLFGGTGDRADWEIAATIASRFPVLLAGGLSPDNVAEAVARVKPWGVDVSSGVERAPGLKDHSKVKRFIENAKNSVSVLA